MKTLRFLYVSLFLLLFTSCEVETKKNNIPTEPENRTELYREIIDNQDYFSEFMNVAHDNQQAMMTMRQDSRMMNNMMQDRGMNRLMQDRSMRRNMMQMMMQDTAAMQDWMNMMQQRNMMNQECMQVFRNRMMGTEQEETP